MKDFDYVTHFALTRRYYERLQAAYRGVTIDWENRHYLQDDAVSFFIHCHSIKEWVKHLSKVDIRKKASELNVETFVSAHRELLICADLANAAKHQKLREGGIRSGDTPWFIGVQYSKIDSGVEAKFTIMHRPNEELIDALDLARKCIGLWTEYLNDLQSVYQEKLQSTS